MVLSDRELARELGYGNLEVDPVDLEEQLQPASLDIRLGENIKQSFRSLNGEVDTRKDAEEQMEFDEIETEEGVVIYPGKFYLADTKEYFEIPDYLLGEMTGRSSLARLGIGVHQTAGLFDSGFSGKGVLEISNVGEEPVRIYPGQRVAQMKFTRLSSPANNPYNSEDNKYQGQEGAQGSRLHEEL